MSTLWAFGGWQRVSGFPVALCLGAVVLALAGCGSGSDGSGPPVQNGPIAYAYVTSAGSTPGSAGAVYEYAIMSGMLSASPLGQASIGAGINPTAVVETGGHVYVVNAGDGTISQYSIAADNTLMSMTPAAVTNPGMHTFGAVGAAAAVDASGAFLYVANTADNDVAQFSIGSDGQLTPLTPSTVATGVAPVSLVTLASGSVYVVNSGVAGDAGSVSQYSQAADGTLMPAAGIPLAAGTNPSAMVVNGDYSTAYVLSNCDGTQCTGSIRQFTVGSDGALSDTGTITATGSHYRAAGMVIDPNDANGYVLTNEMGVDTESGALWHFQVASTGALTAAVPSSLSIGAVALAQIINVNVIYVLTGNAGVDANSASTGGSIVAYGLGTDGTATLVNTSPLAAPYPASMVIRTLLAP